jgi:hypothetical protein
MPEVRRGGDGLPSPPAPPREVGTPALLLRRVHAVPDVSQLGAREPREGERERMDHERMGGGTMDGTSEELLGMVADDVRRGCPFDGCDRPSRTGREPLCEGHYYQRRRGVALTPLRPRHPKGTPCQIEGCDKPRSGNGMCSMHETRVRRHGSPDTVIPPEERKMPRGSEHPAWTGGDASYNAVHQRVRRENGPASIHSCAMGCGWEARQWAYVGPRGEREEMPFSTNLALYAPLCVPCHKAFDLSWLATLAQEGRTTPPGTSGGVTRVTALQGAFT